MKLSEKLPEAVLRAFYAVIFQADGDLPRLEAGRRPSGRCDNAAAGARTTGERDAKRDFARAHEKFFRI